LPLAFIVFFLAVSSSFLLSNLKSENRMLRERLKGRSLRLRFCSNWAQSSRLIRCCAAPATHSEVRFGPPLQAWAPADDADHHRTHRADGPGESRWYYTRSQGALCNLGHELGRGTIAHLLKYKGVEPSEYVHVLVGVSHPLRLETTRNWIQL
jgi:hypothetical protein